MARVRQAWVGFYVYVRDEKHCLRHRQTKKHQNDSFPIATSGAVIYSTFSSNIDGVCIGVTLIALSLTREKHSMPCDYYEMLEWMSFCV